MLTFRFYDTEEKIDYAWYQSSNIVFSKCEDHESSYKTLTVVFKNGATYKYKDVDVNDYVLFLHGGIMGSNGKAFHAYIIKKGYKFEKLSPTTTAELDKLKAELKVKKKETLTTSEAEESGEN